MRPVLSLNGVRHLVGSLPCVRRQLLKLLFYIPAAAGVRLTRAANQVLQVRQTVHPRPPARTRVAEITLGRSPMRVTRRPDRPTLPSSAFCCILGVCTP